MGPDGHQPDLLVDDDLIYPLFKYRRLGSIVADGEMQMQFLVYVYASNLLIFWNTLPTDSHYIVRDVEHADTVRMMSR